MDTGRIGYIQGLLKYEHVAQTVHCSGFEYWKHKFKHDSLIVWMDVDYFFVVFLIKCQADINSLKASEHDLKKNKSASQVVF